MGLGPLEPAPAYPGHSLRDGGGVPLARGDSKGPYADTRLLTPRSQRTERKIGYWRLGIGERIAHAKVAKVGKESRYANVRNPDRVGAGFECGFEFCVAALADLA